RHIVRIFQANEGGLGIVVNDRPNHCFNFLPVQNPVIGSCDSRHATSDGGHRRPLVQIYNALLFAHPFIPVIRSPLYCRPISPSHPWELKWILLFQKFRYLFPQVCLRKVLPNKRRRPLPLPPSPAPSRASAVSPCRCENPPLLPYFPWSSGSPLYLRLT